MSPMVSDEEPSGTVNCRGFAGRVVESSALFLGLAGITGTEFENADFVGAGSIPGFRTEMK